MGLDTSGIIQQLIQGGGFNLVANNPLAQFGVNGRDYRLARLMPERPVPVDSYVEDAIQYRPVIANSADRYSPVQIKQGVLSGSFDVRLGNHNIGVPMDAKDYDSFTRLLRQSQGQAGVIGAGIATTPDIVTMASGRLLNFQELMLNQALNDLNEKMRGQAIALGQITLTGDGGFREVVNLPNPSGHRVTAGGQWSLNTYDPMTDITAGVSILQALGYTVAGILCGTDVRTILSNNGQIKARAGGIIVQPGSNSVINNPSAYVGLPGLNQLLEKDGVPPMETIDGQWRTQTSGTNNYFWPRGYLTIYATTNRDENIDLGDLQPIPDPATLKLPTGVLPTGAGQVTATNTIGYTAIGPVAGHGDPGKVVTLRYKDVHPIGIEGEAVMASLPVLTAPDALFTIGGIY